MRVSEGMERVTHVKHVGSYRNFLQIENIFHKKFTTHHNSFTLHCLAHDTEHYLLMHSMSCNLLSIIASSAWEAPM